MNNLFLEIQYNDNEPNSYEGVCITDTNGTIVQRWATGDAENDWISMSHFRNFLSKKFKIIETSSVDHFIFYNDQYIFDHQDNLIKIR